MVTTVVKIRKPFSGRNFTSLIPKNAPISTKGMAQASIASVVRLMLCQANIWKGSFKKFTHRKNQALVPTKANFGIRVDSRYIAITGPAALPIIVVNPPSKPNSGLYHHLSISRFSFPFHWLQSITPNTMQDRLPLGA